MAIAIAASTGVTVPSRPAGAALACPDPTPQIRISRRIPPAELDTSLTQPQVQNLSQNRHGGRALGLYRAEIDTNVQTFVATRWDDREACVWIDRIELEVALSDRRIYVIRERKPGTCEHEVVLSHERRHERVDDELLAEQVPLLERALLEKAQELGVIRSRSGDRSAAQRRLTTAMTEAFRAAVKAMLDERSRRQAAIDTPTEYRRVGAACDRLRNRR